MKRMAGILLTLFGMCIAAAAGAVLADRFVAAFLPATALDVLSPEACGLMGGGTLLLGLALMLTGGLLGGAPPDLTARRYRLSTGHRLPLLHRARLCRLLRRTAVLALLLELGLLLTECALYGFEELPYWVGRLLPVAAAAVVLWLVGAIGGAGRCPRCGSRLCRDDVIAPPVWFREGMDWPGDATCCCTVCGYTSDKTIL